MTSSMDIFNGHQLEHGLAVIVRQQTQGQGMYSNMFHLISCSISCAMLCKIKQYQHARLEFCMIKKLLEYWNQYL